MEKQKRSTNLNSMVRICLLAVVLIVSACTKPHNQAGLEKFFKGSLEKHNRLLTDVIVADIFTPPVASRIYAYPNIAAYEGSRHLDPQRRSLAGQLNGLDSLQAPDINKEYFFPLSSIVAFTEVAQALVYDQESIQKQQQELLQEVGEIGIDPKIFDNSVTFGRKIASEILQWAAGDGYNRRTALPRYSVNDDPARWKPTPPDYMEAIEPHWSKLRPYVLDSASQFDPGLPTPFDTLENSQFYEEALDVYNTVSNLDSEQLEIAKFWDCNPNISYTKGHVMYFQQQISPGGHWIHIAAQELEQGNLEVDEKAAIMAKVAIALADAFISCWDQKYKSNLTRPETFINTYIDPEWTPILQTPAFPEHTSGHSVASTAAATVLTAELGDHYSFIDATEVPYGLPPRKYNSFMHAAQEAAISRLYGGIHYRPAIEMGVAQGKAIGQYVLNSIKLSD